MYEPPVKIVSVKRSITQRTFNIMRTHEVEGYINDLISQVWDKAESEPGLEAMDNMVIDISVRVGLAKEKK